MCQYFGTMNKIVLCVAVAVAVLNVSEAQPGCPPAACPKIRYPDQCRADSWRIINGQLCKHCDKCILDKPGLSDAQPGCPSVGCPYILHPKECRADAWLMRDGMLCKDCDKCIPQDAPIDNGCPVMPCLLKLIPSECLAKSYFLWKGRLCPDCDVDICPPEPPMSA